VGFAWDVLGDGSTSLRGGYGISYERNFGNVTFNVIQNPPNYAVTSLTSSTNLTYPIFNDVAGPLAGSGSALLPAVNLRAVDPGIKPAYSQFWSVAVDRQVAKNSVLSLEYVGSKGTNLYSIADINQAGFGGIYLGTGNRLNYQYNEINFRGSNAFSNYNGLNVKYTANNLFNYGIMLNANYTWAHSIDDLSSTFTDGYATQYMLGYTNAFDPSLDKGNSDFDTRQRFVLSGVWDMPWGNKSSNAVTRQVIGGWQVSTIFVTHTGNPYTVFDCTNGIAYTCPRWIPSQPVQSYGANYGATDANLFTWMPLPQDANTGLPINTGDGLSNPICSGLLGQGCQYSYSGIGPGPRNAFNSPGYWNFDFVIAKSFKLTERFNLQFRGELYNAFNHHNLYILPTNLDISSGLAAVQAEKGGPMPYGPGTQYDERRNVQFGLKQNF